MIGEKLVGFWFSPAPATRLALLRIILGGSFVGYLVCKQDLFLAVAQTDPQLFAPVGVVFHGPMGVELFQWLMRATILATICLTLGLWHRFTGPMCAALVLWLMCYRHSWNKLYHSNNLWVFHLVVLGLSCSADVWSLDALFRRRKTGGHTFCEIASRYRWPIRLMCGLIVSTYFLAAVAKLSGDLGLGWASGENLRYQMAIDGLRKELFNEAPNPVSYALYPHLTLFSVLAVGSLGLELFAPLALFNRRIALFWCVNTFLMHWGIFMVMHINFHYQLSGLMFVPFFRVERLLQWPRRLSRRRSAAAEAPLPGAVPVPEAAPLGPARPPLGQDTT